MVSSSAKALLTPFQGYVEEFCADVYYDIEKLFSLISYSLGKPLYIRAISVNQKAIHRIISNLWKNKNLNMLNLTKEKYAFFLLLIFCCCIFVYLCK